MNTSIIPKAVFLKDIHKSIIVASREKIEQEGELCLITYTSGVIFVNYV